MLGALRIRAGLSAWSLTLLFLFTLRAPAYAQVASEYQVKAAFVYNFAKFVEWPAREFATPTAPIRICVWKDHSFEAELNHIANGKSIAGRPVGIIAVQDADQGRNCHILFVNSSQEKQVHHIVEVLRDTSVLTVGETRDFVDEGGIIGFTMQDDRVQFQVNHRAANQAGLRISSRLLSLAKRVIE